MFMRHQHNNIVHLWVRLSKDRAFGLLEVMISAMILSISLLGIASIQSRVINITVEAGRTETAYRMLRQLSNTANSMRSSFLFNLVSTAPAPAASACYAVPPNITCTPGDFYQAMVQEWKLTVGQVFPMGAGCTCAVTGIANNKPTASPPTATLRFAIKWTALSGVVSTVYVDNKVVASLVDSTYLSCPLGTIDKTRPDTICNFT